MGEWDSICLCCFSTVSTLRDEGQLESHEQAHRCDPFRLDQWAGDVRQQRAA
jgi:hypothetical protein